MFKALFCFLLCFLKYQFTHSTRRPNYVTTEIKGADCHACLNSASLGSMERVRWYLNRNNKTTASYPTIRLPGLSNVANHYKTYTRSTGSPSLKYEHRYCCVTFEIQRKYYRNLYGKKAYRSCNLRKWKDFNKKQFPVWSTGRFTLQPIKQLQ